MSDVDWTQRLAGIIERESLAMAEILRRLGTSTLGEEEPQRWIDRSGTKITIYLATPQWLHVLDGPQDRAILAPETSPNDELESECTYSAEPITSAARFHLRLSGSGHIQSVAAGQYAIRKVARRWSITIGRRPLTLDGLDGEQDAFAKVLVRFILARSATAD